MAGATVLGRLAPRPLGWRLAEVVEIVPETARAATLVFDVPGWPGHRAGQHLDVRLTAEDGYRAERSYSIASPPEEGRRVAITVERLEHGEVSSFLVGELRPGDTIELRGPIGGHFVWDAGDGALLLVAGGSGLVPLMAMLRHRHAAGAAERAVLLCSSRSLEDLLYKEELDRLAAEENGPEVILTLTRRRPPRWRGYDRRIDSEMLAETLGRPDPTATVFVCGPTRLVEVAAEALVALGHDRARVKTERFGPTGG